MNTATKFMDGCRGGGGGGYLPLFNAVMFSYPSEEARAFRPEDELREGVRPSGGLTVMIDAQ